MKVCKDRKGRHGGGGVGGEGGMDNWDDEKAWEIFRDPGLLSDNAGGSSVLGETKRGQEVLASAQPEATVH